MKRFTVTATKIQYYTIVVEAENKEEAIRKSKSHNEEDFNLSRTDEISILENSASRIRDEKHK